MHEGACEQEVKLFARDLIHCSYKPKCTVTTNLDKSVLITIIACHFQFHFAIVSIFHFKFEYGAQNDISFACYSHCYVTWYPLSTGIVASQCLLSWDAAPVTSNLRPLISVGLNPLKRILQLQNIFTMNQT